MEKRGTEELLPCAGTCGRLTRPSNVRYKDAPNAVIRWKKGYCPACWDEHEQQRPMTERERQTAEALDSYMRQRRARLERWERMGGIEKFFPDIPDFGDKEREMEKKRYPTVVPPLPPGPARRSYSPRALILQDVRGDITMKYEKRDGLWVYRIIKDGETLETSRGYKHLTNARRYARLLVERHQSGEELTSPRLRNLGMEERTNSFREGAVRYVKDSEGKWRYSIIGENGETMNQSEAYSSLYNAKRGAQDLIERLQIEEPDE